MALMGIMVNSNHEWNQGYLRDLREKFLQQEYPMELINEQFGKALSVDRLDLLFRTKQNKTRRVSSMSNSNLYCKLKDAE